VTYDGGYAEFCKVKAELAIRLPGGLSPQEGAFMEPLSCCLHGIDQAGIKPGNRVVVLGAGSIGLMLLQLARLSGASLVGAADPVKEKRQLAESLGADVTFDPNAADFTAKVKEATRGGAEVVIEASGRPEAAREALRLVRPGGTVLFFGVLPKEAQIPISPYEIYRWEINLKGSFTNPQTDTRALELLRSGRVKVKPLISHRFPLEELPQALSAVRSGQTIKAQIVVWEGD